MPTVLSNFIVGVATEKGPRRELNCDSYATNTFYDRFSAVVVDGTGTSPEIAEFAQHAAYSAAALAARRTPVQAIMATAEQFVDPSGALIRPSGAMVAASTSGDGLWWIAWAGDCSAYGIKDGTVNRLTKPHTLGQQLRDEGKSEDEARASDNILLNSLARVPHYGLEGDIIRTKQLILASDGLKLSLDHIAAILSDSPEPQPCAEKLLSASRERGSNDDITVLVISSDECDVA